MLYAPASEALPKDSPSIWHLPKMPQMPSVLAWTASFGSLSWPAHPYQRSRWSDDKETSTWQYSTVVLCCNELDVSRGRLDATRSSAEMLFFRSAAQLFTSSGACLYRRCKKKSLSN